MPGMNWRPRKQHGQGQHHSEVGFRYRHGESKTGRCDDARADFVERTPKEKQRGQNPEHEASAIDSRLAREADDTLSSELVQICELGSGLCQARVEPHSE